MIRIERNLFDFRCLILSILSTLSFLGCARVGGDDLVIATTWTEPERAALEAGFRRWAAGKDEAGGASVRIGWVILSPGDDPLAGAEATLGPLLTTIHTLYQNAEVATEQYNAKR